MGCGGSGGFDVYDVYEESVRAGVLPTEAALDIDDVLARYTFAEG